MSAQAAELIKNPTVGQGVLVYYPQGESGEWCRATVTAIYDGTSVDVYYWDYAHREVVEVDHLRTKGYLERMMPLHVREFVFQMPHSKIELTA